MVLVLVETSAGYALFRVKEPSLLKVDAADVFKFFETTEEARKAVSLQVFRKFKHTNDALSDITALIDSKMGKGLKKFLKRNTVSLGLNEPLAVADKVLGSIIKKELGIEIIFSENTHEIIRGIREQLEQLITGLTEKDSHKMALSLSHTLNRFKLKFSAEKIDTMIIQAVGLLDDIDKELNNFIMRLKEWYGWHFPELGKIVTDNLLYVQTVKCIGLRSETKHCTELDRIVPSCADEIRQAAEISMGTDITEDDFTHISSMCERIIELSQYRTTLSEYLKFRMEAIAPNLTCLVGELVGARLISHAGSLMNLAKHPASTVQILGAEKALFRALKTKQATPKYGLIYNAHLVGQSLPKLKGKASRILAAKLSLCCRVDALGNPSEPTVGANCRAYVEKRIEEIKNNLTCDASSVFQKKNFLKYQPAYQTEPKYNPSFDTIQTKRELSEPPSYRQTKKLKT